MVGIGIKSPPFLINACLLNIFFVTCLAKGMDTSLLLAEPLIRKIVVLIDRYGSPFSIDTKNVPVAHHWI